MRVGRLEFGIARGTWVWGFSSGICLCKFLDLGPLYFIWSDRECKCLGCNKYTCECEDADSCIIHGRELEAYERVASICDECMYDASLRAAQDMGIPDYYLCGYCGSRCNREEILEHCTTKRCTIGLVNND